MKSPIICTYCGAESDDISFESEGPVCDDCLGFVAEDPFEAYMNHHLTFFCKTPGCLHHGLHTPLECYTAADCEELVELEESEG